MKLPALGLTRADPSLSGELLAEQLAAYDPAPLFIPSPMTSSQTPLPEENKPGVDGPFAALPAQLTKTGPVNFPPPVALPPSAVAGLRLTERAEAPLVIGRIDAVGKELANRLGYVEAVLAGSGRVALALALPGAPDAPNVDWQPLELAGAVDRSGVVGELVVTSSSSSSEVDEYFRFHLRKNVRIGERLPAGFYVFRVGP
ncbi:MAG: hypothetical protein ABW223_12070 [Rariglobus sp.]